ncbi:Lipopolysaccharide export system ATP-binding protein LptB [Planctomycetales bacterium 10988]|nr:Lipopolysaccharide export system ATP-binding protein LptB [Planctomycetales bacterium 10988]
MASRNKRLRTAESDSPAILPELSEDELYPLDDDQPPADWDPPRQSAPEATPHDNPIGEPILEATGLVKIYGRRKVVDGVELKVYEGEIVGLLGPNGAGKTTSFNMTCGLVEPNEGLVRLNGQDVTRWPMHRRARAGMGYLAQKESVFRKLTVEQNLTGVMEILGIPRKERKERCQLLLDQFNITKLAKSMARDLSGGERRRLEIARCLVSEPRIILLDEPFAAVDPVTVASIQGIIRDLRDRGIAILITDHSVRETLQITDRSYVIRDGKVLCSGKPSEVIQNAEARKYYFGDSMTLDLPGPHQPRRQSLATFEEDHEDYEA